MDLNSFLIFAHGIDEKLAMFTKPNKFENLFGVNFYAGVGPYGAKDEGVFAAYLTSKQKYSDSDKEEENPLPQQLRKRAQRRKRFVF